MKKRILSLLLVLTLLVTVSVFAVEATEVEKTTFAQAVETAGGELEELTFWCEHCGQNRTWTKWDGSSTTSSELAPKVTAAPDVNIHVYVPSGQHTLGSHKIVYQSVCMYLAGDLINDATNNTSSTGYYMFRLYTNATVTERLDIVFSVMGTGTMKTYGNETGGNGTIINTASNSSNGTYKGIDEVNIYPGVTLDASNMATAKYGCALSATNAYSTINMYGGTVRGGSAAYGGAVYLSTEADFNMYGGEIIGGTATNSSHGGGAVAMIAGATFNMYKGATITGGTATGYTGGAVYMNSASSGNSTFNMYGGIITGGSCTDADYPNGGAVGIRAAAGTTYFNMYGGTISGGVDTNAGAVRVGSGAVFTMNDNAEVTLPEGAQKDTNAVINGVACASGGAVEVNGGTFDMDNGTINGATVTTSGGAVYVAAGTFDMDGGTIDGGSAPYGGAVAVLGGGFELGGTGKIINGVTTGTAFDDDNDETGVLYTGAGGGNVFVHGAETTFDMTGGTIGGYLEDGTSNGGQSEFFGGNVFATGSASFTMSGGKIEAGKCTASALTNSRGANVAVTFDAQFTMSDTAVISNIVTTSDDGTISATRSAWAGANVYVASGSASFTMDGGTINGGTANRGSITLGSGTFTMNNGTINGGRCETGSAIHSEGTVVITGGTINGGTGSAVYSGRNTVTMTNGTINGGTATNGAAVMVSGSSLTSGYAGTFNMQGGTINGGTATNGGAAVAAVGAFRTTNHTGTTKIKSVTLLQPVFNHTGGTINAGTKENPGSAKYGGAVYVAPGTQSITVYETADAETGTKSTYCANATYNMNGATAVINGTNCTVTNGAAVAVAGGQFVMGSNEEGVENVGGTINGGTATSKAGAVYLTRTLESPYVKGYFTMHNGTITGGKAPTGGNVALVTNCAFTMNGGEISLGYSTGGGGNVHVYNLATFTMNGGKVILGSAGSNGGNFYLSGSTGSASYAGKLVMNNGTIAAGAAGFNGNGKFGGNVAVFTNGDFEMHGGVLSRFYDSETAYELRKDLAIEVEANTISEDPEKATKYWGNAGSGDNVAVWSEKYSDITIDGGTVSGGEGNGAMLYVGSYNDSSTVPEGWNITVGAVTVNNPDATSDVYFDGRADEQWKDIGQLTIANGFASKLAINLDSTHTEYEEDGVTLNKAMVVAASDYAGTGSLVYYNNEYEYVPLAASAEAEIVGEVSVKPLVIAPAAIFDGKNIISVPADAQAAMSADIGAKQYVKLFNAPNAVLSLTKDITVDFNGNDATVTLNSWVLTGMDAQTDDYTAEGAATVTFTDGAPALKNVVDLTINGKDGQRKYLYLEGGFHRYYLSIDKAGLRTDSNDGIKGPGISFSGVYRGDEVVANAVEGYGVEFQVNSNKTSYAYDTAFAATERNEGKLMAVHGMMNDTYDETEVAAQAYITVAGETIYSTETASNNLKALVEGYVADYNEGTLIEAFRAPIAAMVEKYGEAMALLGWTVGLNG